MTALVVMIAVLLLAAAGAWVWYCRDSGTHDQPPFGRGKFTDKNAPRPER